MSERPRNLPLRASLRDRFEAKYIPEPNSGCWLWIGPLTRGTYGMISRGRRNEGRIRAHRLSWEFHRGPIPDEIHVLHRCDMPCCVNPDHLFLGTQGDNMRDCARKGRRVQADVRGTKNGRAKLSMEAVVDIRTKRLKSSEFAALYNVDRVSVEYIWRGKTWSHQ